MGQRSQIFINVDYQNTVHKHMNTKYLVARYFGWNYGVRMISRCSGIIEWLLCDPQFKHLNEEREKLEKICDINWDMHDIVISGNILQQYIENDDKNVWKTPKSMFLNQANNDGKLYIDYKVIESENDKCKVEVKYCFTDWDNKYLGSAANYLKWNLSLQWRKDCDAETRRYTVFNLTYITDNAKVMSEKEYNEFITRNYSSYDFVKQKKAKQKGQ